MYRAWSWQTLCWVAVGVVVRLLSALLSENFCQSGCCQWCSQAGWQSKSATKLLPWLISVIHGPQNMPKQPPWCNPNAIKIQTVWIGKPYQTPWELIQNPYRDQNCEPKRETPNPRTNPKGKTVQTQKWKVWKDYKLTNIYDYMVLLTNLSR